MKSPIDIIWLNANGSVIAIAPRALVMPVKEATL